MSFAFAKIWSADKDTLEEVDDVDQGDSWAQTLQKITLEREKVREKEVVISGRGAPRRAAAVTKASFRCVFLWRVANVSASLTRIVMLPSKLRRRKNLVQRNQRNQPLQTGLLTLDQI